MWRLGIDEAGRGPCLGPLVVACVAVPESEVHILTSMGVKDSKRLTTVARERLHEKILQARHSSGWRVTWEALPASTIDLAVKDRGLNRLEYLAFATLLDRMHEPGTDAMAVLDACDVDESRFRNQVMARLELEHHGLDVVARHGADDDDPVVAAASIIAKVERLTRRYVTLYTVGLGHRIGVSLGCEDGLRPQDLALKTEARTGTEMVMGHDPQDLVGGQRGSTPGSHSRGVGAAGSLALGNAV